VKEHRLTRARTQRDFYKTFTRPVAKVLLTAVFTYQLVYWAWVKLETDEIRAETDGTRAKTNNG
jgi:hypothetical protein